MAAGLGPRLLLRVLLDLLLKDLAELLEGVLRLVEQLDVVRHADLLVEEGVALRAEAHQLRLVALELLEQVLGVATPVGLVLQVKDQHSRVHTKSCASSHAGHVTSSHAGHVTASHEGHVTPSHGGHVTSSHDGHGTATRRHVSTRDLL